MNALVASYVQKLLILVIVMLVVIPDNSSTVNSMHTKLLTVCVVLEISYLLLKVGSFVVAFGDMQSTSSLVVPLS